MPSLFTRLYRDINPAFCYGHFPKDYLYARKVKQLRCEESKESVWKSTLHWLELPKYVPVLLDPSAPTPDDLSTLTTMIADEKPQSYTYTTPHVTDAREKPTG